MRAYLFVGAVFILTTMTVVVGTESPDDPTVNGRSMSFWLRAWVEKPIKPDIRRQAEQAFKAADTNVIPYLLAQLPLADYAEKRGASAEQIKWAMEQTIAAEAALRYMGSSLTSAVPQLKSLLASTNRGAAKAAAEILSDLGPLGAHALVTSLTNRTHEFRASIPRVLREMGTNLVLEVPALFQSLDGLSIDEAFDCSSAIMHSGTPTTNLVAGFAQALKSTNSNTRFVSAKKLGDLGPAASGAIRDLERLEDDENSEVRNAARSALTQIGKVP